MGCLCELFSQRLKQDGKVAQVLFDWQGDIGPYGASLPLRLAGALHGLVLEGKSKALRDVYPPHHESITDDVLWETLESALIEHEAYILNRLKGPPQTNEVRRSNALLPGFMSIVSKNNLPLVLSEVGASTGLNLLWDQYHYQMDDWQWGNEHSPVRLTPQWSGQTPPEATIEVISREGCDLSPINPAEPTDRLRQLSYIWPDQIERLNLIRASLDIATQTPVTVKKENALNWLENRLSEVHINATHVIYHTIMWQYMSTDDQQRGKDLITNAGERATHIAPLAWLRLEADGKQPGAALMLDMWPAGISQCIARADFHGRWVNWFGFYND